MIAIIKKLKK